MIDDETTFYGILLDLIEIDTDFPLHIIDLIGKKVLFSFIVKNEEIAAEIIELNKEILKETKKSKEPSCASI